MKVFVHFFLQIGTESTERVFMYVQSSYIYKFFFYL